MVCRPEVVFYKYSGRPVPETMRKTEKSCRCTKLGKTADGR